MTHDEMIAVIQAHKEGKVIEFRSRPSSDDWQDVVEPPLWNFSACDYRAKKEPREFWINVNGKNSCGTALHKSERDADKAAHPGRIECIHVREVD